MRPSLKVAYAVISLATFLIAGCASPTKTSTPDTAELAPWRGRLAVRIESDQPQAMSGAFELSGNVRAGELALYTPLGNIAAVLTWNSSVAFMRANGETRYFDSLDDLIRQAIGTDIPVAALFAWLAGDDIAVNGWRADLTQHANGRVTARRTDPWPPAELRLVLEK